MDQANIILIFIEILLKILFIKIFDSKIIVKVIKLSFLIYIYIINNFFLNF